MTPNLRGGPPPCSHPTCPNSVVFPVHLTPGPGLTLGEKFTVPQLTPAAPVVFAEVPPLEHQAEAGSS